MDEKTQAMLQAAKQYLKSSKDDYISIILGQCQFYPAALDSLAAAMVNFTNLQNRLALSKP